MKGSGSELLQATTSENTMSADSREQRPNEYTIVNTAATVRVLAVLQHWLTRHPLVGAKFPTKD